MLRVSLVLGMLYWACSLAFGEPENYKISKSHRFDPVIKNIDGWTVHIEPDLLEAHAEEGAKALRMLGDHLNRISILMDKQRLEKLRTCEIWIERSHPTLANMQYHPSEGCLLYTSPSPRDQRGSRMPSSA